jgi:hypothetical protein
MADEASHRHELLPEDGQRLNRLSEEIRSRLAEMSYIFGRVIGSEFEGGAVTGFKTREGTSGVDFAAGYDYLELVEFLGIDGCYGSIGGQTVLEWPCGSG